METQNPPQNLPKETKKNKWEILDYKRGETTIMSILYESFPRGSIAFQSDEKIEIEKFRRFIDHLNEPPIVNNPIVITDGKSKS